MPAPTAASPAVLPRTVRPLPGEVVTVPAAGPAAMLRVLTDLRDLPAVAPVAAVPDLDPELDVIGAVLRPTRFLPVPLTRSERAGLGALLEALGLAGRLGRRPHQLPIDDLRRVAFACAVAVRAEVVVIDDPASALDPAAATALLHDLRTAAAEHGVGLVLLQASHPAHEEHSAAA